VVDVGAIIFDVEIVVREEPDFMLI
jgi:hypothetical protein